MKEVAESLTPRQAKTALAFIRWLELGAPSTAEDLGDTFDPRRDAVWISDDGRMYGLFNLDFEEQPITLGEKLTAARGERGIVVAVTAAGHERREYQGYDAYVAREGGIAYVGSWAPALGAVDEPLHPYAGSRGGHHDDVSEQDVLDDLGGADPVRLIGLPFRLTAIRGGRA